MGLTRPKIWDLDTNIQYFMDPITVLHQGATSANVDVGFLFNRANGLVSNVAMYWSETSQSFNYVLTANSGVTDSNISPSSYANVTIGNVLVLQGSGIYVNGNIGFPGSVLSSDGKQVSWVASGGFSGGQILNTFSIANSTAATSTTSGAFQVVGGTGIGGALYVGGLVNVAGTATLQSDTSINSSTASSSTTTGALKVIGGVGIGGNLYVGGNIYASNWITTVKEVVTSTEFVQGNVYAQSGVASTNSTTGALQVTGGAGLTGAIYADGGLQNTPIGNATTSSGAFTTITASSTLGVTGATTMTTATVGGLQATAIGNVTPGTGAFTTATFSGNVNHTNTLYAQGIYDNGTRVVSTSTGAGNLTISGTGINLTAVGPGAVTTGSATAIPVITTDAYGRISAISTASVSSTLNTAGGTGTGSIALTNQTLTIAGTSNQITTTASNQTVTVALASPITLPSVGAAVTPNANATINLGSSTAYWGTTFTGQVTANTAVLNSGTANAAVMTGNVWHNGWIIPFGANATYNIGTTNSWWGTFYGKATQAQYADLAENYRADADYAPGTVVIFGGEEEITTTTISHDTRVAGVISTEPAYLMNAINNGLPVAFTGRVPCQVQGPVSKGTVLVTSHLAGVAQALDKSKYEPGCILGKALKPINTNTIETIEVVVGRF